MIIILIFSLHILLLSVYALFIAKKRSRLQPAHLLFALCMPVIGELCLLSAELGTFRSVEVYAAPSGALPVKAAKALSAEDRIMPDEEIGREELLRAIKRGGDVLPAVLKTALRSSDAEVVHIAAANIMRIQRRHEAEITRLSREYAMIPEDMRLLMQYAEAIDNYLQTGLPDGGSVVQLTETRRALLESYLGVFPNDEIVRQALDMLPARDLRGVCEVTR